MRNGYLEQRLRVCKALLSLMGYEHLWDEQGPTAEAKKILDQYGGPMSNPQWTLYQFIWYCWGRACDVKVQELMQLPNPQGELVVALMHAMKTSPHAVDGWLDRAEKLTASAEVRRYLDRQGN